MSRTRVTALLAAALAAALWCAPARADGMIFVPRPPAPIASQPFPLAVRYHHVTVDIKDSVARTSIDQEFFNPTGSRLEGTYIFPLPPGAALSDFAMDIDGKMVQAELLDAKKAREIYEDIVRRMRDPALLEYLGNGAFKVRIFPIEPRSGKRVKLSYSQVLPADGGLHAYTYPLNTEKFSSAPLEDVSVKVSLETARPLRTLFCPTHEVEVKRKGERAAVVGFEAKRVKPDQDFTLYFSTDDKSVGLSALCHRTPGEDGYFLLTVTPAYDTASRVVPKDITFVLDTSGSMAGDKMAQAQRALTFCLSNLNAEDRFEVVRFSTEAEALFGRLEPASAAHVAKAKTFVESLKPIGGTNAEEALTLALKSNAQDGGRPKVVIFITDGKPTIGETGDDALVQKVVKANVQHLRVFTFGVGDDLNIHFLDKLTEATQAARTYVGDKEDMELKISSFYEKVKSPVLVDLALTFGPGIKAFQTYPKELPDLFRGSQLTVFGRYRGTGDSVALAGSVDGKRTTLTYPASFPGRADGNAFLPALWATQRIGYLLDQIRLHGEERELVDEVTQLARTYGVITPYTSYLILEDERARITRNELPVQNQTLNAPSGGGFSAQMKSEYDAMRGKAGAPAVQASKEVEAMKNATNMAQVNQGAGRLGYKDDKGQAQNLAAQTRNIQGRAVYQVGANWVDSQVQGAKNQQAQRVQFASPEYFALLTKEPQAAQFLALGRNVRFVLNDQVYEVFE